MNPSTPENEFGTSKFGTSKFGTSKFGTSNQRFSRRRLFEFSGATVGLAALLAACGNDSAAEPGRVGNAPIATDPPDLAVDDAVYIRTMQSLEESILAVYGVLGAHDGLGEGTIAALTRFTDDHTALSATLGQLATDNGGEPFACANPWLMERDFQPALDYIVGKAAEGGTEASGTTEASDTTEADDGSIAPTDDAERDTLAMIYGLETLAAATYQKVVELLTTPALRATVIPFGAQAARRAATIAIVAGGDEDRYVAPTLRGEEAAADAVFPTAYAIETQFGRLTPIDVVIGAENDLGLRYTATFQTPADNAYAYHELACPA